MFFHMLIFPVISLLCCTFQMNITRYIWSKTLGCCKLRQSPEIVFLVCTGIIAVLPFMFYLAVRFCGPIRDLPKVLKRKLFYYVNISILGVNFTFYIGHSKNWHVYFLHHYYTDTLLLLGPIHWFLQNFKKIGFIVCINQSLILICLLEHVVKLCYIIRVCIIILIGNYAIFDDLNVNYFGSWIIRYISGTHVS